MRVLLISHPFPWITGGFRRSYEVTKRLSGDGCEVTLLLSPHMVMELVSEIIREQKDPEIVYTCLREVQESGVTIHPGSLRLLNDLFRTYRTTVSSPRFTMFSIIGPLIPANIGVARMLARYERDYLQDSSTYDIVYSHHECLDTAMLARRIAAKLHIPFVILFHNEPYRPLRWILKVRPVRNAGDVAALVPLLNLNLSARLEYRRILSSPQFRKFFVISPAPVIVARLMSAPYMVLSPANAISHLSCQPSGPRPMKGDYAIYASRFGDEKGIFEIPLIWKQVSALLPAVKLRVYGSSSPETREKFLALVRRLSLEDSVELYGYLSDADEFRDVISRARVLLHPSHSDGFSMIIVESLTLGTPVVAYDLPAFTYFYRTFPAVTLVKEWDREAFCRAAVCAVISAAEFQEYLEDPALLEFISHHRSWDCVAARERETLLAAAERVQNKEIGF